MSFPQVLIISLLLWAGSYNAIAGSASNKGFNNIKFLALTDEQKKIWVIGGINALFHVAAAKSEKQGQCVYDWYYNNTPKKRGIIYGSMEKYPDSTPSAILLALTERECGTYRK